MDVRFLRGLAANYAAIATKDNKTFYYVTDEKKLYLGDVLLSNEVSLATFNALEERVKTLEGEVDALQAWQEEINGWKNALPEYVTKAVYDEHITAQDARDDGQDELIAGLRADLDEITEVGGEPNKVDDVKVDGVSVVKDKIANIDLSGKETVGVAAGLVDAAKTELNGEIAKKVAQADYDAAMALKADKSELFTKAAADELYDAKGTAAKAIEDANLGQYTTEQEVKDIVDTVIAGAVEGDTITGLANLVEYINKHGGEAAEMGAAIDVLEGKVETIEGKPAYGITASQIENWDGEVGAKALAQGVKDVVDANKATWDKAGTALQAADKTELEGKINAKADAATAALKSEVEAVDAKFADYTKTADLGDLATKDGLTAGEVGAYTKEETNSAISAATTDMATNAGVDGKLASYRKAADQDVIDAKKADKATYEAYVEAHKDDYNNAKVDELVAGATDKAQTAQNEVDALEKVVAANAETCTNNFNTISNQLTWGSF